MRRATETLTWLADKMRALAISQAAPLPVPPPAATARAAKRSSKPDITKVECPDGVPVAEWREAQRNVELGSARSTIRAGSDLPSDELVARLRREADYRARVALKRN